MPCPQATEPEDFTGYLGRLFAAPPAFTKLEAFAKDWKAIEAQERADEAAELDRHLMDQSDEVFAASRDDGDEGQAA